MAIIKCPECGHQVSEKAPTCPSCGVEIAGNVVTCPDCGHVYFRDQTLCPSCHRPNDSVSNSPAASVKPTAPVQTEPVSQQAPQPEEHKNSRTTLIISFVFGLVVFCALYYYYDSSKKQKEMDDYEYAIQSTDPMVIQAYLDSYTDADPAHRDSLQLRLAMLQQVDNDWTNAVVSGSREQLQLYVDNNPDSPHNADALNKIDSMDFAVAKRDKSYDAYKKYLEQHPDGRYADQAKNEIDAIKSTQVQPEEAVMVKGIFKRFFQSVNSRNEDGMLATVADQFSSFLGKVGAGKSDVVTFLNKIYKADITNMNWHIIDDYVINKRQTADGETVFDVTFTAEQNISRTDASQPNYNKYQITATVDPEGKISGFNMKKMAE